MYRAEQLDLSRGQSSTYACAGCCPDSFFNGWVTPSQVSGFVGDQTPFTAMRQDQTGYGELTAPFETFANFSSLDPTVASCTSVGMATGINPGSAVAWAVNSLHLCPRASLLAASTSIF